MQKQQKFHYSITENGNIQVRLVIEYLKDGQLIDKKYGDPYTPADTKDMADWDDRSKDIMAAITDEKVVEDFKYEKQEPTGIGLEEIVTYDRTLDNLDRISVRRITRIFDEGIEVSKKYHRSWIMPGQDPIENDVISKAVAEKLHTQSVIDAYNAMILKQKVRE